MQIFPDENLVFFATAKAASTSIESVLRDKADQRASGKYPKHLRPRQFFAKAANKGFHGFAVLREPVQRLGSWYRYRQRPEIANNENSTAGLSFEAFVLEYLSDAPKPYAQIGNQHSFVTDHNGSVIVRHLFALEAPIPMAEFIFERFGISTALPWKNTSPKGDLTLSAATLAQLKERNQQEFELYEKVALNGRLDS